MLGTKLSSILTKQCNYSIKFSKRAFISIMCEVLSKGDLETGGLFLGHIKGNEFQVVEMINPGPESTHQYAYFQYDVQHTSYVSNKISQLYDNELELIGLWHRHPGSFDKFSSTDDGTNERFASLHPEGAISLLVNVDPYFRLTAYHVSLPHKYALIPFSIDESLDNQQLKDEEQLSKLFIKSPNPCSVDDDSYKQMKQALMHLPIVDTDNDLEPLEVSPLFDNCLVDYLVSSMFDDLNYLSSKYGITFKFEKGLLILQRDGDIVAKVFGIQTRQKILFLDPAGSWHEYTPNLFQKILSKEVKCS